MFIQAAFKNENAILHIESSIIDFMMTIGTSSFCCLFRAVVKYNLLIEKSS